MDHRELWFRRNSVTCDPSIFCYYALMQFANVEPVVFVTVNMVCEGCFLIDTSSKLTSIQPASKRGHLWLPVAAQALVGRRD